MTETQEARIDDILRRIVETKEAEISRLRGRAAELRATAVDRPEPRDFEGALRADTVQVISEVKRRSPGAGEIRPGLDPADLARTYERHGAAALSVLTDEEYFGGSLADLKRAREAVELPVLRKDFTIDPLQVWEARDAGADCILLIVRILTDDRLGELHGLARDLKMSVLVEVHDERELERARELDAGIVGINNRDLSTFTTDLGVSERLQARLPSEVVRVSESGIRTGEEVARLGRAGIHAILVGETLLRAPDPGATLETLTGHRRHGA